MKAMSNRPQIHKCAVENRRIAELKAERLREVFEKKRRISNYCFLNRAFISEVSAPVFPMSRTTGLENEIVYVEKESPTASSSIFAPNKNLVSNRENPKKWELEF